MDISSPTLLVSLLLASCTTTTNSSVEALGSSPVVSGGSTGTGTVVSQPAGLECTLTAGAMSGSCTASFAEHTLVTLTASATGGSSFVGWTNLASGSDFDYEQTLGFQQGLIATNPLPLDVDSDRTLVVLASFTAP